jgi:hypothetical protein
LRQNPLHQFHHNYLLKCQVVCNHGDARESSLIVGKGKKGAKPAEGNKASLALRGDLARGEEGKKGWQINPDLRKFPSRLITKPTTKKPGSAASVSSERRQHDKKRQ